MLLYHGTSAQALPAIRTVGLKPRPADSPGNWTITSRERRVYLTTGYALYFSLMSLKEGDELQGAILEVDSDKLNPSKMWPDEDFVSQATIGQYRKRTGEKVDIEEYTRNLDLRGFKKYWKDSIQHLGTVAYAGTVLPSAITRVALIDFSCPELAFLALDPQISLMNYKFLKNVYISLMDFIFNGSPLRSAMLSNYSEAGLAEMIEKDPAMKETWGPILEGHHEYVERMQELRTRHIEVTTLK